ncbi:MAG: PfkB family carbohydrate kinase [Acidimicrobiia bacterium]|nr:PfkB family carbohydrate kinase [Acidimicrobiia bacterium]
MMKPDRHLSFVGMTTVDIVQIADDLPEPNQKGWARDAYLDVGGPATNAAITASILGSPVSLHSAFGRGPLGDLVNGLIDRHGVNRISYGDNPAVPVSSIWVVAGDRTLLSTAASFDGPQPDTVDLGGAAAVLFDGFYPDLARAAARAAAGESIPVILDCGTWREVFVDLLPLASVAIVSEQFEFPDQTGASPARVIGRLLDEYRLRFVAVSRGGDPITWATRASSGQLAVPRVAAVDTLAAGDVLHGAFMHFAYREGLDDLMALEQAAAVAARSCEHLGPRAGVEASADGGANSRPPA